MVRHTHFAIAVVLLSGCASGCAGKTAPLGDTKGAPDPSTDAGADAAKNLAPAAEHRSHTDTCAPTVPGGEPGLTDVDAGAGNFTCRTNEECTAHPGGRCLWNSGACGEPCIPQVQSSACAYDTCTTDTDCPAASACLCGAGGMSTNQCSPIGTCRVDADCATGLCSPAKDPCTHALTGFFCHSKQDECANDDDCADVTGVAKPICVVDAGAKAWTCARNQCGGAAMSTNG